MGYGGGDTKVGAHDLRVASSFAYGVAAFGGRAGKFSFFLAFLNRGIDERAR